MTTRNDRQDAYTTWRRLPACDPIDVMGLVLFQRHESRVPLALPVPMKAVVVDQHWRSQCHTRNKSRVFTILSSSIISVAIGLISMLPVAAQTTVVKTTVAYREVDGHKVLADVYRPNDKEIRPVIVWLHGGALIMGHREGISGPIRRLAQERGYALVSFDYRLAPETKLPEIISDIEAAFRWLGSEGRAKFHLDPKRIVVVGGSAGGYLTLVTGYRVEPRPKALVAFWGYGDLVGDWYSKPSPHPRHNPRPISREEAIRQTDGTIISDSRRRKGNGGIIYLHYRQTGTWPKEVTGFDPVDETDKIAPYEPVRHVTADFPPTLLVHGTDDTDVPYVQSVMMAEQFERHGVPHQLITVEGAEHGLAGADRQRTEEVYRSVQSFIDRQLQE